MKNHLWFKYLSKNNSCRTVDYKFDLFIKVKNGNETKTVIFEEKNKEDILFAL